MKFLKVFFSTCILYALLLGSGSQFSACKKTVTVIDTVTVIKTDTVIKKDTVTILDSTYELKDGLVAYYNFNNGNLNDSSGNGNNIFFNNATKTTDRFGRANNAYLFDGSTSYMLVKNSQSLNINNNISLMATVKLNDFNQGQNHVNQLFMKGISDQSQGIYGIRILPSTGDCCTPGAGDTTKELLFGYYGDNTAAFISDNTYFVRTNKWVTVVVTFDGFHARIYVDGDLKNTANGIPFFTSNTNDLFIGKTENTTYPYWFKGVIDEIRIYSKTLSAIDVKQLSNLKQ
jgi:hypothetical protein